MKKIYFLSTILFLTACSDSSPPIFVSSACSVDEPNPSVVSEATKEIHVGGWAFDKKSGSVPEKIQVQIVSSDQKTVKFFEGKRAGIKRPDVAQYTGVPAADLSGFDLNVPANTFSPGNYEISVIQKVNEAIIVCSSANTIRVK